MQLRYSSLLVSAILCSASTLAFATPKVHRGPGAPSLFHKAAPVSHAAPKASGTHISAERATQIQTALIKAGYLSGTPSGTWDAQSQAAMEKLQAEHGWQTKLVPDSRALISLGLGSSSEGSSAVSSPGTELSEPSTAEPAAIPATNQ